MKSNKSNDKHDTSTRSRWSAKPGGLWKSMTSLTSTKRTSRAAARDEIDKCTADRVVYKSAGRQTLNDSDSADSLEEKHAPSSSSPSDEKPLQRRSGGRSSNSGDVGNGEEEAKMVSLLSPQNNVSTHSLSSYGSLSGNERTSLEPESNTENASNENGDAVGDHRRMSEFLATVPAFCEGGLSIGTLLGRGSFSDVFRVCVIDIELPSLVGGSDNGNVELENDTEELENPQEDMGSTTRASYNEQYQQQKRGAITKSLRHSISEGVKISVPCKEITLAMKRLRPSNVIADNGKYDLAAEDLARESAFLASLDHPHVIKIHGRASEWTPKAPGGQFILLDLLRNTLSDEIRDWKRTGGNKFTTRAPSRKQIEVASCIADALRYLHSKNIAFRDLKPQNVGFDSFGVLKLFDFGFAASIPSLSEEAKENGRYGPLKERCGTFRYMAPEVGLSKGHGAEADIYSFGVLLWEICALKKPFENLKGHDKIALEVWTRGKRPSLGGAWPSSLRDLIASCWDKDPRKRPSMSIVWDLLTEISSRCDRNGKGEDTAPTRKPGKIKRFSSRSLSLPLV